MKKKAALSNTIAVILVIVALIIGIGIGYVVKAPAAAAPSTVTATVTKTETTTVSVGAGATVTVTETKASTTTVTEKATTTVTVGGGGELKGEIPIGALLPLTGDLATYGQRNKLAIEIAINEINSLLERVGADWRLKLIVEDTELNPQVALEKLMSLHAKGVKVVIGPMGSASLQNIKEYADSNKILLISQSSTSPFLAIKDDFVFRFVPSDVYQGRIAPYFAKMLGVTHIILVWRHNSWGDGLAYVVKNTAEELGIEIAGEIKYDPSAKEFSMEVASVADIVNRLIDEGVAPEDIMVQLISYEEAETFFLSAAEYDTLWKVRWFGSDGTVRSSRLIQDEKVAEFCSKVRFVSPMYAPVEMPIPQPVTERLREQILDQIGSEPEAYSYNAYDAVWVVAQAIMISGKYDAEVIKDLLPQIVERYYGASGQITLDEYGDRVPLGYYYLYEIVKTDGGYEWKVTGNFNPRTNEITWE
ncbi:MAG TPA: ABC transporter substrate-binding protein [Nitrososphaeria archaeon]|nr:ABC transporter substrate-binding protein [Nitrososphaeria archaeon]